MKLYNPLSKIPAVGHRSGRAALRPRKALLAGALALATFAAGVAVAAGQPLLDINRADGTMIAAALTGIGPVKAQAIVDYRDVNGPFSSLDELQNVPGIGSSTLERIRGLLTLEQAGSDSRPIQ